MAFCIKHERKSRGLLLICLANNGIYFRNTRDAELKRLGKTAQLYLQPNDTWIIVLGSIQIALSTILRDHSEQQAHDRNLKDYIARFDKANPDFGKLNVHGSTTSTMVTPGTRILTGIWGTYTAAGKVGEGGMGYVSLLYTPFLDL